MNQTTNPTFQDLARQIRISSPTAINRSFDETIKCKSLEMNNERMLAILNKNKLEEFRNFWSFDGKLEKERKDNNIIMEDLVVEEVTHYRAGQNLWIIHVWIRVVLMPWNTNKTQMMTYKKLDISLGAKM